MYQRFLRVHPPNESGTCSHHQSLTPAIWWQWVQMNDLHCPRSFVKYIAPSMSVQFSLEQMPQTLQDEVRDAINTMRKGKAPGIDGITTELLQGGVVKTMHTLVTKI